MRRPRGPGGRFLTSEEIAAQKHNQPPTGPSASTSQDGDDEDEVEMVDRELDQDTEMILASPVDHPMMDTQAPHEAPLSAQQPFAQPRPRIQIPVGPALVTKTEEIPRPLQSQPQQNMAVQSPYEHPSMSHNIDLLSAAYMSPSHPATPAAMSPHANMADGRQAPDRQSDHAAHAHGRHGHGSSHAHDHGRHGQVTVGVNHGSSASPSTPNGMRIPYAAMQMHHVPHPHAHARHHHTYVNRTEQLYPPAQAQGTTPAPPDVSPRSRYQAR